MDSQQIAEMERAMEEEHRKDRDALQRLKRFLPQNNNVSATGEAPSAAISDANDLSDSKATPTILATVATIMQRDSAVTWDWTKLLQQLKTEGHEVQATRPSATINRILRQLKKRGVVRLTRRGKGTARNTYRAIEQSRPFEHQRMEETAAIH